MAPTDGRDIIIYILLLYIFNEFKDYTLKSLLKCSLEKGLLSF